MKIEKILKPKFLSRLVVVLVLLRWGMLGLQAYNGGSLNFGMLVKPTGELAWMLLLATIFISLVQKILVLDFPKFTLKYVNPFLPVRKATGVLAFLVASFHGMAEFLKRGDFADVVSVFFSTHHAAVLGTISVLIMLPLFLTSTDWAMEKMGYKFWKNLQKLAHAAFVFAGLHFALLHFFDRGRVDFAPVALLGVYLLGYGYLFARKFMAKR